MTLGAHATSPESELVTLDTIVRNSTTELCAAYEIKTKPANETGFSADFALAGIIGFTGPIIRGTLLLAMTREGLQTSNPVPTSPPREWMGELANQLLGRIKTQLLACGVEIYVTTPIVLRGQHLAPEALRAVNPLELMTKDGPIIVWFESDAPPDLELRKAIASEAPIEGDSFIF